ncbi:MAG TPA: hypothetical protein VGD88_10900 [Opitutaceae bacterium]
MNPQKSPEITVQTLLALRKEEDAVRLITERLRVKEMGPADHIRTKHEVKMFIESGTASEAEKLLSQAAQRHVTGLRLSSNIAQKRGQQLSQ